MIVRASPSFISNPKEIFMERLFVRCFFLGSAFLLFSCIGQGQDKKANEQIENRASEIVSFLSEGSRSLGQTISDRDVWESFGKEPSFRNIIKDAENTVEKPIPDLSESLYKEYFQNGNRTRYQNTRSQKYRRVHVFALAECLENQGRFIAPLEETIRSICDDPSWVLPAHDYAAEIYDGKATYIDLTSADTSIELALAVSWLGDKLSTEIKQLVRDNIERRTFEPYEKTVKTGEPKRNWWIRTTNNWNTVCHAGVVGAAILLIESPERRAWYVASAEYFMDPFFRGFTDDGYCSEGMGYWNYGFGHFVELAEIVYQATDGKVDFFKMPKVKNCALFGPRMEVAPGQFAAFADCAVTAKPDGKLVGFLSRRLQFGFKNYENRPIGPGNLKSTAVYCFPNSATKTLESEEAGLPLADLRTEFPDAGVLICRPKNGADSQKTRHLAMTCKAGHNAEHHNHNDVGAYTVMFAGSMPVLDPGGEVYTRRTFSKERYDSKLLNSFGHPVPVVNGQLQKTGRKFEGQILSKSFSDEKDVCVMDIAPAYGLKEITKLERQFEFSRTDTGTPNSLVVRDLIELESAGDFEEAFLTYEAWKISRGDGSDGTMEFLIGLNDGQATERTVRVVVESTSEDEPIPFEFESIEIDEDAMARKKPTRFGFKIKKPIAKARFTVTIIPI